MMCKCNVVDCSQWNYFMGKQCRICTASFLDANTGCLICPLQPGAQEISQ